MHEPLHDPTHETSEASSRRRFLAALAATGVAVGATTAASGQVQAAEPGGVGDPNVPPAGPETRPIDRIEAFPAPTAGITYRTFIGADFHPTSSAATYTKGFGEVRTTGIYFRGLHDLPVGSRIAELSFAVVKSTTFTGDVVAFLYRMTSGDISLLGSTVNTNAFPQSNAEQYLNYSVPADTMVTNDTDLWMVVNIGNNRLNSVRVGYVPPAVQPSFFPIAPKRAYDSRFVAPTGTLGSGGSRTVSVADGYPDNSGTVSEPGVVPAGATAVAYNLTITGTAGAGFLSVNPGGALASAGSSINWGGPGVTIANGLVGTLGGDRQFTVFCGGTPDARTHFIIDVLGYYR